MSAHELREGYNSGHSMGGLFPYEEKAQLRLLGAASEKKNQASSSYSSDRQEHNKPQRDFLITPPSLSVVPLDGLSLEIMC